MPVPGFRFTPSGLRTVTRRHSGMRALARRPEMTALVNGAYPTNPLAAFTPALSGNTVSASTRSLMPR
jgi:hypothetical protein